MNKNLDQWLKDPLIDKTSKEAIKKMSPEEKIDAFYQKLSFGTAGLRGKLGPGSNRMNIYTVGLAVEALSRFLKKEQKDRPLSVVIAHDTRHMSQEFTEEAGQILRAHGIQVFLFKNPVPTPLLAYSVRYLGTSAGIMITASHNPKEYNGLKVYNHWGIQIDSSWADKILMEMNHLELKDIKKDSQADFDWVAESLIDSYFEKHLKRKIHDDINKDFSITYTPLNGVGNLFVRRILRERGFTNVHVVKVQEKPDPDFTTVGYPNPENFDAFACAIDQAEKEASKFILATDPDSDRVSLAIYHQDQWVHLNGNQIGALLMDYILHGLKDQNRLPENPAVVKSIVTGDLGFEVAKELGIERFNTLTGFKNICAPAVQWEQNKEYHFIFGYEESIGYIYGDDVFDKDAVIISMILCEMAGYYDSLGRDLVDQLHILYEKYKPHRELLYSTFYEGAQGVETMNRIMDALREQPLKEVGQEEVTEVIDYQDGLKGKISLAPQNLIQYQLKDQGKIFFRPSGTEPKLKVYIYLVDKEIEKADQRLLAIQEALSLFFKRNEEK